MGWQVIIAPSAQTDLAEIVRYIARHNSDVKINPFELWITRQDTCQRILLAKTTINSNYSATVLYV